MTFCRTAKTNSYIERTPNSRHICSHPGATNRWRSHACICSRRCVSASSQSCSRNKWSPSPPMPAPLGPGPGNQSTGLPVRARRWHVAQCRKGRVGGKPPPCVCACCRVLPRTGDCQWRVACPYLRSPGQARRMAAQMGHPPPEPVHALGPLEIL